MQKTLPTPSQPEPENKCLGCLFMKLEGIPVQPEHQGSSYLQPTNSTTTQQINLYLTLLFNEQRELLIDGRIKFGLKGGKLKLKLINGEIPWESSRLAGLVELSIEKQTQHPQGMEHPSGTKVFLTESKPVVKVNSPANQTAGKTETFQRSVCQVTIQGSQENPAWIFEVEKGKPVLKGLLKSVLLATLNVTAKPCCIEATFEVSPRDVYVTEAEGLWPKNISKKRSAVIERAIARRFLERKLKPYLSRHKLQYDE